MCYIFEKHGIQGYRHLHYIYKLTEHPVVLLNGIFKQILTVYLPCNPVGYMGGNQPPSSASGLGKLTTTYNITLEFCIVSQGNATLHSH